jgi:hypothetical protein
VIARCRKHCLQKRHEKKYKLGFNDDEEKITGECDDK